MGLENPARTPMTDHVTIFMAVYNGEAYLLQQLDSISKQTHKNWSLVVGDDQSTDASRAILLEFQADHPNVEILDSCTRDGSENFMSLLRRSTTSGYIAFSDQDDIWLPERLSRGLEALQVKDDSPALYCSRTWIVDEEMTNPRLSRESSPKPSFRNALLQNIAAGNTLLLNRSASALVLEASREAGPIVAHDWWIYQVVTGAGGRVIFDNQPTLYYRQHRENHFGENKSFRSRFARLLSVMGGQLRYWNDKNLQALKSSSHRLTPGNADLLLRFENMRKAPLMSRLSAFNALGLYRQRPLETALMRFLALCGKL